MPLRVSNSVHTYICWCTFTRRHCMCYDFLCADGSRVLIGDAGGYVSGWDIRKGALLTLVQPHSREVSNGCFNGRSDVLITCGKDGHIAFSKVGVAQKRAIKHYKNCG